MYAAVSAGAGHGIACDGARFRCRGDGGRVACRPRGCRARAGCGQRAWHRDAGRSGLRLHLSGRQPVGATAHRGVEFDWRNFSFQTNVQSVDLPTHPAAEVTFTGGYDCSFPGFDCDAKASYFCYPGETPIDGGTTTSYAECSLEIDRKLTETVTLNSVLAYAPNYSNTGARGAYAEGGVTIELPRLDVFNGIDWKLIASAGCWRFGDTAPSQGGFRLPAFVNWKLGVTFELNDNLSLDLAYWDTSLSREDCFVFTGDLAATPGGVANPDGLRSRLCGAAFVATLTATINVPDKK